MGIKQRSVGDNETVQAPAPKPDGVLKDFPNQKQAAFVLYGGTDPVDTPIDDLVAMMRMPQNDENLDIVYRNRIRSRMTAIRAFCVFCAGSPKGARMCPQVKCPLWGFRQGSNALRRAK